MNGLTLGQTFVLHEEFVHYTLLTSPFGSGDSKKASSDRRPTPRGRMAGEQLDEPPLHALSVLAGASESAQAVREVNSLDQLDPWSRDLVEKFRAGTLFDE